MNILIINCHTANRGDEAAVHGLVDELNAIYPGAKITLSLRGDTRYPNLPDNVVTIKQFIPGDWVSFVAYKTAMVTGGRIRLTRSGKNFLRVLEDADIVLHAPGGPSIGDTYYDAEPTYLRIFDLVRMMGKPYLFYAPSMGPFRKGGRNPWRKKVISNAEAVVLRDPISAEYVKELLPAMPVYQTLDSAFQHDIDMEANKAKLEGYPELRDFLSAHERCVGVTITDLLWHPVHSRNPEISENIRCSFRSFLGELEQKGYGIIFIPQLYGTGNDRDLMQRFAGNRESCFVIADNDDRYDTYFQQYLIGQLFAVIGMRYHSNIFSAKMGTPFVSVSYEQKMQGFMEKMSLSQYCLKLDALSPAALSQKFDLLCKNYPAYRSYLAGKHSEMKADAYKTTEMVRQIIENNRKSEKD